MNATFYVRNNSNWDDAEYENSVKNRNIYEQKHMLKFNICAFVHK